MPSKKKKDITYDITKKNDLTTKSEFIEELAKANSEKMFEYINELTDIEYVICYPLRHNVKFYPNMVKIKTYTKENRDHFLSVKDVLNETNDGLYIYIERNGGDMVIRDCYDVVVEV